MPERIRGRSVRDGAQPYVKYGKGVCSRDSMREVAGPVLPVTGPKKSRKNSRSLIFKYRPGEPYLTSPRCRELLVPMSASHPTFSPLARLVLFMVCLSIAGTVVAGAHYGAVDLPQQNALQPPENGVGSTTPCAVCKHNCKVAPDYYDCLSMCDVVC